MSDEFREYKNLQLEHLSQCTSLRYYKSQKKLTILTVCEQETPDPRVYYLPRNSRAVWW